MLIWLKMATSGYINGVYYPNLFVSGENVSSDPKQHVLKPSRGSPSLMGTQSILLTYVSEKANGEFVTQGYEAHEFWSYAGDYLKPQEKIPKKTSKCPHEGVEGILNVLC